MLEVLIFLFENYMHGDASFQPTSDEIAVELERIGFDRYEIDRALSWLDGLARIQQEANLQSNLSAKSMRYYTAQEKEQLGVNGQGYVLSLEQAGILDPISREIVIDRLMALGSREIDIPRIRWVVLMVLFSQPEKQPALAMMQDIVLADALNVLH